MRTFICIDCGEEIHVNNQTNLYCTECLGTDLEPQNEYEEGHLDGEIKEEDDAEEGKHFLIFSR